MLRLRGPRLTRTVLVAALGTASLAGLACGGGRESTASSARSAATLHGDGAGRRAGTAADPVDGGTESVPADAATGDRDGAASGAPLADAGPRSHTAFVDRYYRYLLRVELARIEGTPLAPEVRHLLEAVPRWRRVMDETGLDPLAHIDRLFVASPARRSPRYLLLARHDAGMDRVRRLVAALAEERNRSAPWSEVGGFRLAPWRSGRRPRRVLLVLSEHWVAVAPRTEVARLVDIAGRRGSAELTPGEPMPWGMDRPLAPIPDAGLHVSGRAARASDGQGRKPHYPLAFEVVGRTDADGNVTCEWRGRYGTVAAARKARAHWDARRRKYADHPVVGLLGLKGPIAGARWKRDESELRLRLELTLDEMGQLIHFATPILVGARR